MFQKKTHSFSLSLSLSSLSLSLSLSLSRIIISKQGYVGGGRANWDGTGGSGAALRHYEETGKRYPLAVKLGTITPDGGGDVYSYAADEDDMVLDPDLPKHLRHWGINAGEMRKTDKTVAEMQVDLNLSFEFDRITEAGGRGGPLRRLGGPGGLVGMHNLGNSCYVASVLQALYCLPPLRARYAGEGGRRLLESAPADAASDLLAQTAKVVTAMVEGKTGKDPLEEEEEEEEEEVEEDEEEEGGGGEKRKKGKTTKVRKAAVRPAAFKRAAGAGHPEFSGVRQQDAVEYLQHLLERLARAERAGGAGRGLAPFALPLGGDGGGGGDGDGDGNDNDNNAEASPSSSSASASHRPTADALRFAVEEKITCGLTGAARYGAADANVLSLDIPLEAATNAAEVEAAAARAAKRAKVEAAGAEAYIGAGKSGGGKEDGGGGGGAAAGGGEEEAVIDATAAGAEAAEEKATTTTTTTAADDGKKGDDKNTSTSEPVLPRVPLSACLAKWAADETVEGYRSAAAGGAAVTATRRQRLASFPPFLAVQLKRYYVAADWTPRKLEVLVDVPETLDLAALRGSGPQPGEALQPEEKEEKEVAAAAAAATTAAGATATATAATEAAAAAAPEPDPELVASLVAMGFSENGSKRAVLATASGNAGAGGGGVEGAMEWVLAHMEDPDFNDPLPPPPSATAAAAGNDNAEKKKKTPLEEADPDSLAMLGGMGFEARQAAAALRACGGSLERAADWLFSRADGGLDAAVAEVEAAAAAAGADDAAAAAGAPSSSPAPSSHPALPPLDDARQSTYRLAAVVSHMGRSTACGHYVAHARRNGQWALFNDDKVAASARVPTDLGFLYLFARDDVAREAGVVGAEEGKKEAEEAMKE